MTQRYSQTDRDGTSNVLPPEDSEAEEAVQLLDQFVDGRTSTNTNSSTTINQSSPFVAPDHLNNFWAAPCNPHREAEKFALLREVIDALPGLDIIRILNDVFVTRCQGPLSNVVHTPTFLEQAEQFYSCLDVSSPDGHVLALYHKIPMDKLACHLLALVLAIAFHPSPSLHGWVSTPLTLHVEELRATGVVPKALRSLALRCLKRDTSLFCGSIASLQAATMLLLDGHEESLALDSILVTAISGAQKLGLHRLHDAELRIPASDSPSTIDSSRSRLAHIIRTETGVRIWWALVMRDWARGLSLGYYSIHPSQFNTRMPLHINDDDLHSPSVEADEPDYITERPRSEFTNLSYTVYALEIASLARETVDLRGLPCQAKVQDETRVGATMGSHLITKYEDFLTGLPPHFSLGSIAGLNYTATPMAAIPVHRWMLQQQMWSLFLRLHRAGVSTQEGRAACQLLAQNIINTQGQIQARCVVCGSLYTNKHQLFNAAVLLLLGLLSRSTVPDTDGSSVQLSRLMTRNKIREAIELLKTQETAPEISLLVPPREPQSKPSKQPLARRSLLVLNALMKLEESLSKEKVSGACPTQRCHSERSGDADISARGLILPKVRDVLNNLSEATRESSATSPAATTPNSVSAPGFSTPLPTNGSNGPQELD
ncbi:MAG: hypothetical protein LQ349_007811, partial [Xanthoria aureola]